MAYTQKQIDEIIELRKQNLSVREICDKLGHKKHTVSYLLSKQKIYKRDNKLDIVDEWTDIEKAYIAGIIDGEGSIIIGKLKPRESKREVSPRYQLYVKITNTNKPLIEWLCSKSLTNIQEDFRDDKRNCFTVHWPVQVAIPILEAVRPYMLVKQDQVDLAARFRKSYTDTQPNEKLTAEVLEEREWCYQEMKRLHQKEYS